MADEEKGEARWQRRGRLAMLLRAVVVVVPFGLSVATLIVGGRVLPRPSGGALLGWYAGLFAASWAVLWLARRALHRLLPLVALLELTLNFPEAAPSRLTLAKRSASTRDLAALLDAPARAPQQETTQQAAERILTLMAALARHDRHTRGHAERVRAYTDLIATKVGLPRRDRDKLQWAALLHDIGKLAIPTTLLNKPAKPNPREWEMLKGHPDAGARIVAPLMDWLGDWGEVIPQHHEHYDGGGYPRGLSGQAICHGARIVSVADSLEVMTAARPYKRPIRKEAAMRELVRCSGTQFDPDVVRALLAIPGRRLMVAMGPTAWLAGLPFIGQAPAQLVASVASQTAASAGVAAVVVTGVHPATLAAHHTKPPAATAPQQSAKPTTLKPPNADAVHTHLSGGSADARPSGTAASTAGATATPAPAQTTLQPVAPAPATGRHAAPPASRPTPPQAKSKTVKGKPTPPSASVATKPSPPAKPKPTSHANPSPGPKDDSQQSAGQPDAGPGHGGSPAASQGKPPGEQEDSAPHGKR